MIMAFDANIHGLGHVPFNRAMVAVLVSAFGEDVELFINESQCGSWISADPMQGVLAKPLRVSGGSKARNALNALLEVNTLRRLLNYAISENASIVVALSLGPLAHFLLPFFGTKLGKIPRFVVTLHGELQELERSKRSLLSRAFWLRAALRMHPGNVTRLCLGSSILHRLQGLGYDVHDIVSIDHPCLAESIDQTRHFSDAPLFVVPGGASRLKGTEQSFRLAALVREGVGSSAAHFALVGSWSPELDPWDNGLVSHGCSGVQLASDEYERDVRAADFLCFLYPPNSYSLMASGALLDSVRFGRPVLCLRTRYFESLFAGRKPFGKVFDSLEELAAFIISFVQNPDPVAYRNWLIGLEALRQSLDPKVIGPYLACELDLKRRAS